MLAIGTLFLIFLASYFMLRSRAQIWPPPGCPPPPEGLWLSTLILLVSSVTVHQASIAAREENGQTLRHRLGATLVLGALFLGVQIFLWRELLSAGLLLSSNAYGAVFYSLTGLHGLHVLGGLAFLWIVFRRSEREDFFPEGTETVRLCASYWHFMDLLWIVLFAVLYFLG